jgi:hypothetical protein
MSHKVKILGAALFVVLVLTAASAGAASAASYTASAYPTTGTGTSPLGNGVFTTEGGKAECAAHYQGTLASTSEDLTVTAIYTGCKAWGFVTAAVASNCTYTFTTPTGSGHNYQANIDVVGAPCTISVGSTCKVSVPNQGPLNSVALTTDTAAGDLTMKANVTGIEYDVVTDHFGCPFNGVGRKTGGTYVHGTAVTFDSTNGASLDLG